MTKRQKHYVAFALTCFAICVIAVFVILSWSANYNYCVGHNGAHDSGQYNYKGLPIFVPGLDSPSAFHLFVHCGGVFAEQHAAGITGAATFLLMLITGGLVVLGYMQFTTSRTQLRAYISIETVGIFDGAPNYTGWPNCNLTIKNSGQTPARNVKNWTQIDVGALVNPSLAPLIPGEMAASNIPSGGVTIHNDIWMKRQLAANEIAAIQNKAQAIYAYGKITYVDVFGTERETEYMLRHTGSWPPLVDSILYFTIGNNSFT